MIVTNLSMYGMQARTLRFISILLDLKDVFLSLLKRRHKNSALLNMYAFIDICASLSRESESNNRTVFESYLKRYSTFAWQSFNTYDLWAARSAILHSYSALGDHTTKEKGAKPIFYFSWPEKKGDVNAFLLKKGYSELILLDVMDIKEIAVDAFNTLYNRLDEDPEFEAVFLSNAQHILSDLFFFQLDEEWDKLQNSAERDRLAQ
jgi:hypothetical protein